MRSGSESASWSAAKSPRRPIPRPPPSEASPRPEASSAPAGSRRAARSAGRVPKTTAAAAASPTVKRTTLPSTAAAASCGSPSTVSERTKPAPQYENRMPRAPAAAAKSALSANRRRTSRARPAPSALRTASSRSRQAARVKSRFATLPQAISSTRSVTPNSAISGCRMRRVACSVNEPRWTVTPSFSIRPISLSSPSRRIRAAASASAWATVTPVAEPGDDLDELDPDLTLRQIGRRRERVRQVELGLGVREAEAARHDPDDLVAPVVEPERAAEDLRVAAELAHPEGVAQDRHPVAPRDLLLGAERPPERGRDAEDLEELRRDHLHRERARLAGVARESAVGRRTVAVHRHPGEDGVRVAPGAEVVRREGRHLVGHRQARTALPDPDEPLRLGVGGRLQQHPVHRGEDGRGGPDADRQREADDRDERRPLRETLRRLGELVEHSMTPLRRRRE